MSVITLLVSSCAKDEAVVDAQPDERNPRWGMGIRPGALGNSKGTKCQ